MTNCVKVGGLPGVLAMCLRPAACQHRLAPLVYTTLAAPAQCSGFRPAEGSGTPAMCDDCDWPALRTVQVHGPQCLRCTYSTVRKVSAKDSCCTAVRDVKAYAIQRCQVGERAQTAAASGSHCWLSGCQHSTVTGVRHGASIMSRQAVQCGSACGSDRGSIVYFTAAAGPGYQLGRSGKAQPCAAGSFKPAAGSGKCARCSGGGYQPASRARATEKVATASLGSTCIQHPARIRCMVPTISTSTATRSAAASLLAAPSHTAPTKVRTDRSDRASGCRHAPAASRAGRRCSWCGRRSPCCRWGRPGRRGRGQPAGICCHCTWCTCRCQRPV